MGTNRHCCAGLGQTLRKSCMCKSEMSSKEATYLVKSTGVCGAHGESQVLGCGGWSMDIGDVGGSPNAKAEFLWSEAWGVHRGWEKRLILTLDSEEEPSLKATLKCERSRQRGIILENCFGRYQICTILKLTGGRFPLKSFAMAPENVTHFYSVHCFWSISFVLLCPYFLVCQRACSSGTVGTSGAPATLCSSPDTPCRIWEGGGKMR